ncbi:Uncharacterised protein at_DN2519 [Pycnogonum litorale]
MLRHSKYDPSVEEVELISSGPSYANIRTSAGKESTVSLRDLAPAGSNFTFMPSTNANFEIPSISENHLWTEASADSENSSINLPAVQKDHSPQQTTESNNTPSINIPAATPGHTETVNDISEGGYNARSSRIRRKPQCYIEEC